MKLLALATLGYITIGGLTLLAQDALPAMGAIGPLAQLGAVGVMGWLTKALIAELRESRVDSAKQRAEHAATLDSICARFDGWEQIRHADAEANRETLRQITAQCARAQVERESHGRRAGGA